VIRARLLVEYPFAVLITPLSLLIWRWRYALLLQNLRCVDSVKTSEMLEIVTIACNASCWTHALDVISHVVYDVCSHDRREQKIISTPCLNLLYYTRQS